MKSAAVVAVWLLVGATHAVHAEPILITGGFLQTTGSQGYLNISGTRGFTLQAGVHESGGLLDLFFCAPCLPGTTSVSVLAAWSGNDLPGTVRLSGKTYPQVGSLADLAPQANVAFSGVLALPPVIGPSTVLTGPFLFAGMFTYYRDTAFGPVPFDEPLTGRGMTTVQFVRSTDVPDAWQYASARYEFSAAPVPEPATLLLVTGGLLAGFRRARNGRRRSGSGT